MDISVICNNCGAPIQFDDTKEYMFCWSCGQKILRLSVLTAVMQQQKPAAVSNKPQAPRAAGSNLAITYDSSMSNVNMTVFFGGGSQPVLFTSGKSKKFHLEPGHHEIVFQIGNRSYRRSIDIIPGGAAYKVECGWCDGRAYISILQPSGGIIGS
ncbi:MAG: hypothetical protein IKH82_00675 [Clostridiales bacterium]|nr:hypothetical protein [Clostridiales bacterium]